MFLSVIIPAYNEEKTIEKTLNKIIQYLSSKDFEYEIIVVNDGSKDRIIDICYLFPVRVISLERNQGKGAAVQRGVQESEGEWVLFLDADYSTHIDELDNFMLHINDYDILIGSRAISGAHIHKRQSIFRVIMGKSGNLLIRLLMKTNIHDTQCGFKLFNRRALSIFSLMTIKHWGFDFELLYLAKKSNFKVKELPVHWQNNSNSTLKLFDYLVTLKDLIRILFIHRY